MTLFTVVSPLVLIYWLQGNSFYLYIYGRYFFTSFIILMCLISVSQCLLSYMYGTNWWLTEASVSYLVTGRWGFYFCTHPCYMYWYLSTYCLLYTLLILFLIYMDHWAVDRCMNWHILLGPVSLPIVWKTSERCGENVCFVLHFNSITWCSC